MSPHRDNPATALERAATEHWQAAQEFERAAAVHRAVMARLQVDIDALHDGRADTRPGFAHAGDELSPLVETPAATIPGLAACLLGPFYVALHGTAVAPWRSQKAASLLKYLLLHNDRQATRRDILMDAFWPFSSAAAARNNLNVTIYTLLRVLHEIEPDRVHIVFSEGAYVLNPDLELGRCRRVHRRLPVGAQLVRAGRFGGGAQVVQRCPAAVPRAAARRRHQR